MLTRVAAGSALIVCTTCRLSSERREDAAGRRGGQRLADLLRIELAAHRCRGQLSIQEMPCLFTCSAYCTVHLRCEGKIGYVLGRFSALPEDAGALLDYAALYCASPDGIVAYALWPERIKGHFIVRIPPQGFVWERESLPVTPARDTAMV